MGREVAVVRSTTGAIKAGNGYRPQIVAAEA